MDNTFDLPQYSLYSYASNCPDPIYILDTRCTVVYVNPAFTKLYGWSMEDLITRNFPHIPLELHEERKMIRQYLNNGMEALSLDTFRTKKNGEWISVSITISPIKDRFDHIIAFVCLSRDVTESKLSEKKYFKLFNRANDAIFFYEQNDLGVPSKFLDVNEAACQRLGYSKQELLSKSPVDIADKEYYDKFDSTFRSILQGNTTFEWVHIRKDGSKIPVEISSRSFKLNQKTMIVSIARDLTDRKKTEEFLRKTESISLIGELSAGIAHEIRNPLTSIRGFVQLLFSRSEASVSFHDLVISEVDRINSIIGELLLLAKPTNLEYTRKDLVTLLKQIVTLLNAQAHLSDNEVVLDTDEESLYIICAENKLKQVFINILKNAIEASPKGTEILVQARKLDQHILIRCIDQGNGIPAEILRCIGSPFFTTKSNGTGLGIMISQKIIQDHYGTIEFIGNHPKGTIVEIQLPITGT